MTKMLAGEFVTSDIVLQPHFEIQLSLLPDPDYEESGVSIHSIMRPAKTVGGDYYDVVEPDEGRLAFVVADVAGKGVPPPPPTIQSPKNQARLRDDAASKLACRSCESTLPKAWLFRYSYSVR